MLSPENIADIMRSVKGNAPYASETDLAFVILCDVIEDKDYAYRCAFGRAPLKNVDAASERPAIKYMQDALKPFGIGGGTEKLTISREENQSALIAMLADIEAAMKANEMDKGQALKMMADIRVKLQDKFDMEEDKDEQKHIIVVPQKHDIVCKYTNRECSQMPSKAACMEYYNLKDSKTTKTE